MKRLLDWLLCHQWDEGVFDGGTLFGHFYRQRCKRCGAERRVFDQ
jgi:hypothetical protein